MRTAILEFTAFLSMIVGIFTGEYFIKNYIEESESFETDKPIIYGLVHLRKYHNFDAAFDSGRQKPKLICALSIFLTVLASGLFIISLGQKGSELMKFGLSLLLGGAYSNTYDRIKRHYVVDYISFPVKNKYLRNLIFNLSDFCIMIGAIVWTFTYSAQ